MSKARGIHPRTWHIRGRKSLRRGEGKECGDREKNQKLSWFSTPLLVGINSFIRPDAKGYLPEDNGYGCTDPMRGNAAGRKGCTRESRLMMKDYRQSCPKSHEQPKTDELWRIYFVITFLPCRQRLNSF